MCDIQKTVQIRLTLDQQHIKRIDRSSPIRSKNEFNCILKTWAMLNSNPEAKIGSAQHNQSPWIFVELGSRTYYLNSDTKLKGVIEYLKNKDEEWSLIENENGVRNKAVNTSDQKAIEGFYLYKE